MMDYLSTKPERNIPLQIVWPWILMLSVGAKRTNIAWAIMYETMPNHFVLPLKAFAPFTPRATFDGTVMGSTLAMDISMGTV